MLAKTGRKKSFHVFSQWVLKSWKKWVEKRKVWKSLIYGCKTFYVVFYFTCVCVCSYVVVFCVRFSLCHRHTHRHTHISFDVFFLQSVVFFCSFKTSFYLWLPVIYIFPSFFHRQHMLAFKHFMCMCEWCVNATLVTPTLPVETLFSSVVISNCRFVSFILLLNNFS